MSHELPKHTDPATLAVLLDALADQNPAPKSPKWERDAERGLTAGKWHTCPTCNGDGTTKRRNHTVTCPNRSCQGAGGWNTDAYSVDGARVDPDSRGASELSLLDFYNTAETIAEHSGAPGIDRVLLLFARKSGDDNRPSPEPHPCYAQLLDGLRGLSLVSPHHVLVLHAHHISRLPIAQADLEHYDDALGYLSAILGHTFRAPHWARVKAQENLDGIRARKTNGAGRHALSPWQRDQRDTEIRRLAERGDKPTAIGKRMGLDRRTVERILAKPEQEAA